MVAGGVKKSVFCFCLFVCLFKLREIIACLQAERNNPVEREKLMMHERELREQCP